MSNKTLNKLNKLNKNNKINKIILQKINKRINQTLLLKIPSIIIKKIKCNKIQKGNKIKNLLNINLDFLIIKNQFQKNHKKILNKMI